MKISEGTLLPAYGRDYRSKSEVIKDFRAGKDFMLSFPNGLQTYCGINDGKPGEMVKFRYAKKTKAFFYTITTEDKKGAKG